VNWLTREGRWDPVAYVILPDHLHIIFRLGDSHTLDSVMASFGKYTGRQINALNGWTGSFWQHYYYDRRRSDAELRNQIAYVRGNPVKKGYVKQFEDWPYGWCAEGRGNREIASGRAPHSQIDHLGAIGDVIITLELIHLL
jgi:hypothetical protein